MGYQLMIDIIILRLIILFFKCFMYPSHMNLKHDYEFRFQGILGESQCPIKGQLAGKTGVDLQSV